MKKFFLIALFAVLGFSAHSQDSYLGEIRMVAFPFAPQGWALCNGQQMPINQYQALYALLGTTYGGDGRSFFNLPDLRGRLPLHPSQGIPGVVNVVPGQKGGAANTTLLPGNLPFAPNGTVGVNPNDVGVKATLIGPGLSQPINTQPPYLGVNFIICVTNGIFPPRD